MPEEEEEEEEEEEDLGDIISSMDEPEGGIATIRTLNYQQGGILTDALRIDESLLSFTAKKTWSKVPSCYPETDGLQTCDCHLPRTAQSDAE
jgi:hypothetical protein